jgi:light-regulated signal transduction histidine kinase (bacteriophytochrome)
MPSLTMNLVKRVERLPKPSRTSEALQPLFEAISNSVQSTQAKFGNKVHKNGRIVVTVETGRKQQPVRILVEDNGVGLDKKNYEAFVTTDTDNKIAIGGKGVGRLLWLDCFEAVHVESNYKDGATMRHRSSTFDCPPITKSRTIPMRRLRRL